ncbi:Hypothetical protein FKW44_002532, partial [Caligus rogercresseyi]
GGYEVWCGVYPGWKRSEQETLSRQKKVLEDKKKRKNKLAGKKIFEDLEKKADDDMDKMEMKPVAKERLPFLELESLRRPSNIVKN